MPLTAAGVTAAATLGSALYNVGSGIYNSIYQQRLQNRIFNREDNAVTRRYKDLIAAGINPNLAAGAAAGAGSVVGSGRPLDTGINAGQIIDAATAGEQLKQQKYATDAAKDYAAYMRSQAELAKGQQFMELAKMAYTFGLPVSSVSWTPKYNSLGDWYFHPDTYSQSFNQDMYTGFGDWKTSPFFNSMQAGVDSALYNRGLLKKEYDWYSTRQVFDQIWNGVDAGIDVAKTVFDIKQGNKPKSSQGGRDFIYDNKGRMQGYRDFKFQP